MAAMTPTGLEPAEVAKLARYQKQALVAWHADIAGDDNGMPWWPLAIRELPLEMRLVLATEEAFNLAWQEKERRQVADDAVYFTHGYGSIQPEVGDAIPFDLDAKNTARPTPELTRRALGLFPERLLDPDREWVTGEGGTGFEGASYTVRGGKVTIFVTTEAGALAHRIDWRRRAATRERCDRWECENPGKRVMRTHRAFRHPASRFDQSNPEHGAFVTFTRKQILAAVAEQSGPQQMELAL